MAVLESMITQLLLDGFLHRPAKPSVTKKAAWWLLAMSAVVAVVGLVYLMIALHAYLLTLYDPIGAALLTGGLGLMLSAIGGITFFIMEDARKAKARMRAAMQSNSQNEIIQLVDELTKGLEGPIANNPRMSVALASIAGFVSGHRMH